MGRKSYWQIFRLLHCIPSETHYPGASACFKGRNILEEDNYSPSIGGFGTTPGDFAELPLDTSQEIMVPCLASKNQPTTKAGKRV